MPDFEKKITPQSRYDKAKTKFYAIKVVKTTEQDIINRLDEQKNKAGYIKSLIRKDIAESTTCEQAKNV